jgi:acetone carboxylase gamma subunit
MSQVAATMAKRFLSQPKQDKVSRCSSGRSESSASSCWRLRRKGAMERKEESTMKVLAVFD